jgi:hypothetical protein
VPAPPGDGWRDVLGVDGLGIALYER